MQPRRTSPGASLPSERPGDPLQASHATLAEAERCRRGGDLGRAQQLCESLLKSYPDYVGALQTLGAVHLERQNFRQALPCFVQSAICCPKDAVNLTNLGTVYLKLGARQLARQALEEAQRLRPEDADVLMLLAELHREEREYGLAADMYRRILLRSPSHAAAHGLADACMQLGDAEAAAAALVRAHELRPDSVAILYSATQVPEAAAKIDLLAALGGVRRQPEQEEDEFRVLCDYTRAAALDRLGRHEEAWAILLDVNGREFPRHEAPHRAHMSRLAGIRDSAARNPPPRAGAGAAGRGQPLSVFMVGPSRSGKSTLERLIAELDGVKRGFESRLVEPAARRTSQLSGLLTVIDPAALPRSLDGRFREIYLEELRAFAAGARVVTDTHPGSIASIGRIAATLPGVRFVFLKRDFDDVALRMFMKPYRAGNHYAYSVPTIFEYLRLYYDLVDLWIERLPQTAMAIDYGHMIEDPADVLARIAEFCSLAVPAKPLARLPDDRGCAAPYRHLIAAAR
jgi:tetratricopeptide (TPR) repeat protein